MGGVPLRTVTASFPSFDTPHAEPASDEARWVTGVILPVHAGATAGSAPSPGLRPNTKAS